MNRPSSTNPLSSIEEIKSRAARLAERLRGAAGEKSSGGGSARRGLTDDLRHDFLDLRSALFQRGVYDPVLVRFDSATAPSATNGEIADQLEAIAGSLTI
jgi:hypothetical protein